MDHSRVVSAIVMALIFGETHLVDTVFTSGVIHGLA